MKDKAVQLIVGFVLGLLCYAPPALLLGVVLPMMGGGGRFAFGILAPFLAAAVLIFAVITQVVATIKLIKNDRTVAALGVWLVYPLILITIIGHKSYVEIRTYLAALDDYSSRELVRPDGEVRHLLLEGSENRAGGLRSGNYCYHQCIALLRSGVLESVAKPSSELDGILIVFRHARGAVCNEARQNNYDQGLLIEAGYFDECITATFSPTVEWDVGIRFGGQVRRPYGPCCNIAEIYTRSRGRPDLIARFEEGDGRYSFGPPFTIADILSKLTGEPIETEIPPYPMTTVEAELARLAAPTEHGPRLEHSYDVIRRIRFVLLQAADRDGISRVTLSEQAIDHLLRIAPAEPPHARRNFFSSIELFMDPDSADALTAAEARRSE